MYIEISKNDIWISEFEKIYIKTLIKTNKFMNEKKVFLYLNKFISKRKLKKKFLKLLN